MHHQSEGKPPDQASPGNPPGNPPGKKRKKISWKSALGIAVALFIAWQVVHVVTQSQGTGSGTGHHAGQAPPPVSTAPKLKRTPAPMVTLGGHRISAGGGPMVVLNPGLAEPGGRVDVIASGFPARASLLVRLRTSRKGAGQVVAHGRASSAGMMTAGFTMPGNATTTNATVIVAQPGGSSQATAQLATPGGMGSVTIDGKTAGKPGDVVTVSATGFGPGERVNVFWGRVAGTPATTLTADPSGSIQHATVKVGIAPVGPTTLVMVGTKTHTTATAPYLMLGLYPNTTAHPYAVKAGHSVNFTGSGFAPNEPVLVYLNAATGTPALTSTSNAVGHFAVSFVVPFGLRGSQRLYAIGSQSRAAVSSGFDVLPYRPSAQASTYGALPGTTLTFYGSGFAANEVVLVYVGGGQGRGGQLVSAFRVNAEGSASSAGQYVVPSGVGPALIFSLVGQESHGTATAKVSVQTPAQQVTVPPQPPYVLPPSLGGKPPPTHSPSPASPGGSPASPGGSPVSQTPQPASSP